MKYGCCAIPKNFTEFSKNSPIIPNEEGKILYYISNFTKDMDKWKVIWAIDKAFQIWQSEFKSIKFEGTKIEDEAHVKITFAPKNHEHIGCPFHFDGKSGVLAHAFNNAGHSLSMQLHLDEAENWQEMHSNSGTDLLTVLIHEIGHCLNLGHSLAKKAIMYAMYNGNKRTLHSDDKEGIATIYGKLIEKFNKLKGAPKEPIKCFYCLRKFFSGIFK